MTTTNEKPADAGNEGFHLFDVSEVDHLRGSGLGLLNKLICLMMGSRLALWGSLVRFIFKIEGPKSIGVNRTRLPHPQNIVINGSATIGRNVTIYHNVTIGYKAIGRKGIPTIADDVVLYPGAIVIGGVKVGKGAIVGAGSVVLHDVPPASVVAGNPAKVLGFQRMVNLQG